MERQAQHALLSKETAALEKLTINLGPFPNRRIGVQVESFISDCQ